MARYVIEIDLSEDDCSFCPCFSRSFNDVSVCNLNDEELSGELEHSKHGNLVMAFHRPDWCPLVKANDDEALSLVHDLYAELFDGKPFEMHGEYRKRALDAGADVRDLGW